MDLVDVPETPCTCGGRFRLDVQYLMDARRFGCSGLPVLWRCSMCGRSLTDRPVDPARVGEPALPETANDPCGEALLDELTGESQPSSVPSLPSPGKASRKRRTPSRQTRSRARRPNSRQRR